MSIAKVGISVLLVMSIVLSFFTFGVVQATEANQVTYIAKQNLIQAGSFTQIGFDINVTLTTHVVYTNLNSQPSSACLINATLTDASLTTDYHISVPLMQDIDGSNVTQIPPQLLSSLLGSSQPIPILDKGVRITLVLHRKLVANNITVLPQGSATPTNIQWVSWTPNEVNITSNGSIVTMQMDTAYEFSVTTTVSVLMFDVLTKDSSLKQFSGIPTPIFQATLPTATPSPTDAPIIPELTPLALVVGLLSVSCVVLIADKKKIAVG